MKELFTKADLTKKKNEGKMRSKNITLNNEPQKKKREN